MGEGNAWRLVPNYFGGYPWQKQTADVLEANSPYTFVEKHQNALLIKHGENDLRTGVIQSEMLYKSLKILGRPVEYVRMPGGTHEMSRSGTFASGLTGCCGFTSSSSGISAKRTTGNRQGRGWNGCNRCPRIKSVLIRCIRPIRAPVYWILKRNNFALPMGTFGK